MVSALPQLHHARAASPALPVVRASRPVFKMIERPLRDHQPNRETTCKALLYPHVPPPPTTGATRPLDQIHLAHTVTSPEACPATPSLAPILPCQAMQCRTYRSLLPIHRKIPSRPILHLPPTAHLQHPHHLHHTIPQASSHHRHHLRNKMLWPRCKGEESWNDGRRDAFLPIRYRSISEHLRVECL
jgi:hypothetical protein